MEVRNLASVSMKGGRKDQFFFCLLEYFKTENRWFLRSILQVKDEDRLDGNEAIFEWIKKYSITDLILDVPLSMPPCHTCEKICEGLARCSVLEVQGIYQKIELLLKEDYDKNLLHPKTYEHERHLETLFDPTKDDFKKTVNDLILSRSFKRRLKKGFLPYWNRPLDFYIWLNYYDALLELFNNSYDSFQNISVMLLERFRYLKRHFAKEIKLYESHSSLILIELLRSKVISKQDIKNYTSLESSALARRSILKAIEKHFQIFMYEHDLELLISKPRAFDSFLLSLALQRSTLKHAVGLPEWTKPQETNFVLPIFHGQD